jgi:chemotaxis family two-component system response regulator Rcp1
MFRLLLVEDNPGDVGLIREAIRTSQVPIECTVARDGEVGLAYLRNSRFDLVILDLNLPRCDGAVVLQTYGPPPDAPPIVVFSSSHRYLDRELVSILGAKEYVVKPVYLEEFLETVRGIVHRWCKPMGACVSGR